MFGVALIVYTCAGHNTVRGRNTLGTALPPVCITAYEHRELNHTEVLQQYSSSLLTHHRSRPEVAPRHDAMAAATCAQDT